MLVLKANPPQWQSVVHWSAALAHLQCPLYPLLHPQFKSSWQALVASGNVVQMTSHPLVSFFHPRSSVSEELPPLCVPSSSQLGMLPLR